MSKVKESKDYTEDQLRERELSKQKRKDEIDKLKEEARETAKRREENIAKALEARKNNSKKKNNNLSYQIMFGVLGAIIISIIAMSFLNQTPPLNKVSVIDNIKISDHNHHFNWKQGPSSFFEGSTLADAKALFTSGFSNHNNLAKCYVDDSINPPESFHVKDKWPQCVQPVANTGKDCNSSYAFAIASTLAERACIANGASSSTPLSAQEILTCDVVNNGCKGGYLNNSLDYVRSKGIVTESCLAYKPDVKKCEGLCENPVRTRIDSYCLLMEEDNIKRDIMRNGSAVSTIQVHTDLLTYKSGIYTKGDEIARFSGQHTIKIVGWGVESEGENIGTKYWIIENNWGSDWGEEGYAKIAFGQDLFFDHYAYGIKAKVDKQPIQHETIQENAQSEEENVNLDLEDTEEKK